MVLGLVLLDRRTAAGESGSVSSFRLIVPGEPTGKGRPKFSTRTGRAYTPGKTASAEGVIAFYWEQAGRPRLEGPLAMTVHAFMSRPKGHWGAAGLSAQGRRSPVPTKTPDGDNLLKLAADSLNGLGYHDDAQIVEAFVAKRWADRDQAPHTMIHVYELAAEDVAA